MKVGLLIDGDCSKGVTPATRFGEMFEEAVLADELGFHSWGVPEQHFAAPNMTTASQDALLATVAARTKQLRIRFAAVTAAPYNHPVQTVERVSMMDNITGGRAELALARGNARETMDVFGVDPSETREIQDEMIRATAAIFSTEEGQAFEWHGKHWDIPRTENLTPRPVQQPYPAMYQVASSADSCKSAGEKGLGVLFLDNYLGWDYIDAQLAAYAAGRASMEPIGKRITEHRAFYCPSVLCAPTDELALEDGAIQAVPWFEYIHGMYQNFYKQAGYEYFELIETVVAKHKDLAWMREHTPSVMIGTPEYMVEKFLELERRGVDEVLMRVDGWDHERHMRTIELIGKYVIPEVSGDADKAALAGAVAD
jgi:alkanesulfonate monooxygenase SsuD/methylene tetrahydromethanopterin reductase-like flavin-dependent oxidoreductase (luciferase family)